MLVTSVGTVHVIGTAVRARNSASVHAPGRDRDVPGGGGFERHGGHEGSDAIRRCVSDCVEDLS